MINFCHSSLKPFITCDKVCADDYGVENLITGTDYWASQRGFRAERFIIPPVSVTVHFPCNIHIAKIALDPVVGRQKSLGFEIFSCSKKVHAHESWLCPQLNDAKSESVLEGEEIFVPIGKEVLREPCVLSFENQAYKSRPPFNLFQEEYLRADKSSLLRCHRKGFIFSVSAVTIRITQTVERSAPALKRLEIWGQPSNSCPRLLQTSIFHLYMSARAAQNQQTFRLGNSTCSEDGQSFSQTTSISNADTSIKHGNAPDKSTNLPYGVDIPEDFIDPITCDIMTVPLTLPSGKTIDQLTLDKHIQAESNWGRPPSDPFTGVAFNDVKKPVPNVSLKLRIDQFVLSHSSELKTVPRVLGRSSKAKLVPTQTCVKTEQPSATYCPSSLLNGSYNPVDSIRPRKRKYDVLENSIKSLNTKVFKVSVEKGDERTTNHEAKLNNSLDAALYAALGGLPSFQKPNLTQETQNSGIDNVLTQPQHYCVYCNKEDTCTLYSLECQHFSCRTCLTRALNGNATATCDKCGKDFSSKNVTKLNL